MSVAAQRDRVIYADTLSVTLVTTAQTVSFATPMPGPYDIYIKQPATGVSVTSISNQTLSGFTLNMAITLAGALTWAAVERRS